MLDRLREKYLEARSSVLMNTGTQPEEDARRLLAAGRMKALEDVVTEIWAEDIAQ